MLTDNGSINLWDAIRLVGTYPTNIYKGMRSDYDTWSGAKLSTSMPVMPRKEIIDRLYSWKCVQLVPIQCCFAVRSLKRLNTMIFSISWNSLPNVNVLDRSCQLKSPQTISEPLSRRNLYNNLFWWRARGHRHISHVLLRFNPFSWFGYHIVSQYEHGNYHDDFHGRKILTWTSVDAPSKSPECGPNWLSSMSWIFPDESSPRFLPTIGYTNASHNLVWWDTSLFFSRYWPSCITASWTIRAARPEERKRTFSYTAADKADVSAIRSRSIVHVLKSVKLSYFKIVKIA